MNMTLKNLINEKESVFLEFKRDWYWNNSEKPTDRQWGEFLKDFIALVNCNEDYTEQNKYLIIGVSEKSNKIEQRLVDTNLIDDFTPTLDKLKLKIIEKIDFYFSLVSCSTPIYSNFTLSSEIINNKRILFFEIKPATEIIILHKDLQDKTRTEKKNNVFVRSKKKSGDPEVTNASPETIGNLTLSLQTYKKKRNKEVSVEKSIEKTINLFVKNNSTYVLSDLKQEKIWKENILYEVYKVTSDFVNIDFIYIFDKTNQKKTYNYLINKKIISDESIKYILIDNGLKKDINGIKNKFKAKKVYSLDDFALEYLYKEHLNEDIYHDGGFKKQRQIKNFIEPFTENSEDKNALIILSEWLDKTSKPLMVVKGYGGVGKTTLVKYFLDDIYESFNETDYKSKILFIDSKKIIDEISMQGNVDNIFSFYKAYAKKQKLTNVFNKELLELSLDNGNLLIVLDGIDEVIAKLGNKFNVETFISSIYNNYLIGNERAKIIVTCRDYFWNINNKSSYDISTLELLPFTEKLAKKFFLKEFLTNSKELQKCLDYSNDFKLTINIKKEENVNVYIPYILDVIMDMVRQNQDFGKINKDDVASHLLNSNLTNDYFIGRICNREIEKLNNLDIDSQLVFFMNMAVYFNGVAHKNNRKKLFRNVGVKDSEKLLTLFKGHTLVSFDKNTETLSFKYDFFREYFINLFVSKFFIDKDISKLDHDLKEIISEYIRYDNSFTSYICDRTNYSDELKLFVISMVEQFISNLKIKEDTCQRGLISSMLILLLVSLKKSNIKCDIQTRTSLLEDVFGKNYDYLSLINIFGKNNINPTFNFKDIEITNAWFENYEYFWECKINASTSFRDSTFNHLLPRDRINIPNIHKNLFIDCDTSGIKDILDKSNIDANEKENSIKQEILKIFRLFEQGSTFKEQKIEHINKRANQIILDVLINKKVITPYKNPKKPKMKQYRISEEYFDVIKILEQNGTNVDLQKILSMF